MLIMGEMRTGEYTFLPKLIHYMVTYPKRYVIIKVIISMSQHPVRIKHTTIENSSVRRTSSSSSSSLPLLIPVLPTLLR